MIESSGMRRTEQGSESSERIIRAATQLFAARGFHGVSTREIAAAAGLNIATVHYHLGSKQALYRAVFERIYQEELALLAGLIERVDPAVPRSRPRLRALLEQLSDALLDQALGHPATARLWIWRWLEQAEEISGSEAELAPPIFQLIEHLLERAKAQGTISAEVDLRLLIKGFTWLLYSYVMSGPLAEQAARAESAEPASFRSFLRQYICRMLDL
jgi:AcrR family transcriptional regulator